MTHVAQTLRAPLAQLFSALIVLITVLAGTFWLADMGTLTYQGNVLGQWHIDAADFRASIYVQVFLSIAAIGVGLAWAVVAILSRRNFDHPVNRKLAILLGVTIILFLALYSAHRWFETIICAKGSIPSECTL